MIGHIEPQEQQKRTTVAIIVAIIIACVFCFVIYNIWKVFSPKDSYSGKKRGWDFKRNWLGYLIMIPALVSILLWTYYPMLTGSQLFFQDYRVVGDSRWVGFDNLAGVLFSDEWWSAIWNTFRYMMFTLTLGFLAPIVLAILLQEVSHGKIVYRTLYYLPAVMSGLVVIFMWKLFYQAGSSGILNQTLNSLASLCGLEFTPQDWLNDAKWAMLACVIPTIWACHVPDAESPDHHQLCRCVHRLRTVRGNDPDHDVRTCEHGGRRTAYLQGSLHESSVWKRHFNGVGAGNDDVDVHHLQSQETFQNGIQDNGEITWLS